jgi:hypothetical protein
MTEQYDCTGQPGVNVLISYGTNNTITATIEGAPTNSQAPQMAALHGIGNGLQQHPGGECQLIHADER